MDIASKKMKYTHTDVWIFHFFVAKFFESAYFHG